jgi:hypothetical protein
LRPIAGPGSHQIVGSAACWQDILQCMSSLGTRSGPSNSVAISSPYTRPCLPIPSGQRAGQQVPCGLTSKHLPQATGLCVATFGWFELRHPTKEDIQGLCVELLRKKVHVCIVTGLPSELIRQWLQGTFGYQWFGEWRPDHQLAGMLVWCAISPHVRLISTLLFSCPACSAIGEPTWAHICNDCTAFRALATAMGLSVSECFAYPSSPGAFRAIVVAIAGAAAANDHVE